MEHADPELLRVIMALLFVLALMGGLVVALRKMGYAAQSAGKKRLKLVEVMHLDSRRKLAIIQRDEKQHLVILGAGGETLIERGIEPASESGQDTETIKKDKK